MFGTTETFVFDMGKIASDWGDRLTGVVRQSTQDISEAVIEGTPVDTGFARASWWMEIGTAPTAHPNPPPEPAVDQDGIRQSIGDGLSMALGGVSIVLLNIKLGDTIGLYNSASYIVDLEYGSSAQAPVGMVRINALRWPQIVNKWLAAAYK
jgi:hypothetical protein